MKKLAFNFRAALHQCGLLSFIDWERLKYEAGMLSYTIILYI